MSGKQKVIFAIAIAAFALVFVLAGRYEDEALRWVQQYQSALSGWLQTHPASGRMAYLALFVLFIGCYLPGGILFLLLSGALFSFWEGLVIASLGNALGATVGFLLSRTFFHDRVREKFPKQIALIDEGMAEHGIFYLLLLRVAPIVPSPIVNAVMGISDMRLLTYSWVTLVGRIPMTVIYVKLGAEFASIESLSDLLSGEMIGWLLALCLLMIGGQQVAMRLRPRH